MEYILTGEFTKDHRDTLNVISQFDNILSAIPRNINAITPATTYGMA